MYIKILSREEAFQRLLLQQRWLENRPELQRQKLDDMVLLALAESANEPLAVIQMFTMLTEAGITPSANVLSCLSQYFRSYLNGNGGVSLDHAFGLKPKQRVGHPISHQRSRHERGRLVYMMWCKRKEASDRGNVLSILNAAGQVINELNLLDISEDTLEKEYSAFNADSVFDAAYTICADTLEQQMTPPKQ